MPYYLIKSKNLWIGTQNGLNRYIPEKDAFERIPFDPKNPNSISDKIILSKTIAQDQLGRIWIGTDLDWNGCGWIERRWNVCSSQTIANYHY